MRRLVAALLAATLVVYGCSRQEQQGPANAKASVAGLIDINHAGADQLMTLEGISEARARAIIGGRPYARKEELTQREILSKSVYDDIRDRITAGRQ